MGWVALSGGSKRSRECMTRAVTTCAITWEGHKIRREQSWVDSAWKVGLEFWVHLGCSPPHTQLVPKLPLAGQVR